jgi:hypothetical protein
LLREDHSAFKLAAGGKFNSRLGVEIAYVNLGDVALPSFQAHQKAQGADLSLVASAKVFDRVGINAKIGGVYGWTHTQLRAAYWGSGRMSGAIPREATGGWA